MSTDPRTPVALGAVAETLLWTLHHRAVEARRPDAVIADPLAIALVERIDYPFAERFGAGAMAQWQALRARAFDEEVRRFAAEHPGGTVVALGEGLETQFWRVDDGRLRWLSVDLEEVIALRRELLPEDPRLDALAMSALDARWLDEVDPARGVLVTAQGLLMYLEPRDVERLVVTCARRLPGQGMMFDTAPRWLSERSRRGVLVDEAGYRPPPWPWGMDRAQERRFAALPGVATLRPVGLPRGRGALYGLVMPALTRAPLVRRLLPAAFRMRFASPGGMPAPNVA